MTKLSTLDLVNYLKRKETVATNDNLVIVGVLKGATASSVQFSADNLANWLTLPTALIEEVTCLGVVEGSEANKKEHFPLFSITLKTPETQSERFLLNLIMPPFFMAYKNKGQAKVSREPDASARLRPGSRLQIAASATR